MKLLNCMHKKVVRLIAIFFIIAMAYYADAEKRFDSVLPSLSSIPRWMATLRFT